MSLPFSLRFDFRNPPMAGTSPAERYEAALDMAEWGDKLGCVSLGCAEHHGSSDGYIPSPLVILTAMAARTSNVRLTTSALIAPFYDPLRLAEDLIVLDHISKGRIDLMIGAGYVPAEFEMYGVSTKERVTRVTELVSTIRSAFRGEPFEFRGRTVHITPSGYRPDGPKITLGGSVEATARRAARIADAYLPVDPEGTSWEHYRDELRKLGGTEPGPQRVGSHHVVMLSEDPEKGWAEMSPYFLHETNAYAALTQQGAGTPYVPIDSADDLRETGVYKVLTPEQYVEQLKASPMLFAPFHPLVGGMPIDLAWTSLELFESKVMPAFA